jgi:hypothetical protein
MLKIDRTTLEYLKDLSDPETVSSSDSESIRLKRDIIKTNFLTVGLGTIVIGTVIILFIFFLPGLYKVTFEILFFYFASLIEYWKLLLAVFVVFVALLFFTLRRS